jgi:hypothetical protein
VLLLSQSRLPLTEGHGAEADLGNLQAAAAETAVIHPNSPHVILNAAKDRIAGSHGHEILRCAQDDS